MQFKFSLRGVLISLALFLGAFLLLGAVSVAGWEYSNSNAFCGSACHEVHPEEPRAHQMGKHANVACVECHIGRLSTFASFAEKSGHIAHAWNFVFGYERPTHSTSLTSAQYSCEGCHTKTPHDHNLVNTKKKFAADRRNTETRQTLTMRLAGRTFGGEVRRGVNWHASGAVRFIADDAQNLNIRWVEVTAPDGEVTIYNNVRAPLSDDEIEAADKQVMDCVDCHNRAGHPFRAPEEQVDEALADGTLSPDLPFIKQRIVTLLEQEVSSEEEAQELVRQAWADYQDDFPKLRDDKPEAWQSAQQFMFERHDLMTDLMLNSNFEGDGVSWRSFPDHNGHKLDPGCFRCHGGQLQTAAGQPITVNCTNCHSIPLVTKRERVPDYFLALIDKRKPDTHHDPGFMSKHMDLAGEECEACHESIRFGVNDRTYCSNSGCHGATWEYLDAEALRTANRLSDGAIAE